MKFVSIDQEQWNHPRKEKIQMRQKSFFTGILVWAMGSLILTGSAFAQISCKDVQYGNPNYSDKMDELAKLAKLPDDYWNRYHESVISSLCRGDVAEVDGLIDQGSVKVKEVQSIAKVLGKIYKPKQRTETGKRFGSAKEKFLQMGACSACADNIADYYANHPNSPCGKLAKKALEGHSDAIKKLVAFPDYCRAK
jgi:hypothetical protein